MPTPSEKLEQAKRYLGSNWVLAKGSTYDAKKREHGNMCKTLGKLVAAAIRAGRL